jgi:hypothetical protein
MRATGVLATVPGSAVSMTSADPRTCEPVTVAVTVAAGGLEAAWELVTTAGFPPGVPGGPAGPLPRPRPRSSPGLPSSFRRGS